MCIYGCSVALFSQRVVFRSFPDPFSGFTAIQDWFYDLVSRDHLMTLFTVVKDIPLFLQFNIEERAS